MRIAVTGGIGSGKSYVCRILASRGIEVYDCDSAAKRLMRESDDIRRGLMALVGDGVYTGNVLNKAVMAEYILRSEDDAKAVNNIVHPYVADDFIKSGMQWMECAILFESGFDRLVDVKVCVAAPEDVRISRIMSRDAITREKAVDWMRRQMPQEEVARRCDHVIVNDGIRDVEKQIEILINELK